MSTATLQRILAHGASRSDAYRIIGATGPELKDLFQAAAQFRGGRRECVSIYSRKVLTLLLTCAAIDADIPLSHATWEVPVPTR
jgi:hypothetical protein